MLLVQSFLLKSGASHSLVLPRGILGEGQGGKRQVSRLHSSRGQTRLAVSFSALVGHLPGILGQRRQEHGPDNLFGPAGAACADLRGNEEIADFVPPVDICSRPMWTFQRRKSATLTERCSS